MKCDWCERRASRVYPILGTRDSDGCFVRACRAHAGTAEAATSDADRPQESAPAVEQHALFDAGAFGA